MFTHLLVDSMHVDTKPVHLDIEKSPAHYKHYGVDKEGSTGSNDTSYGTISDWMGFSQSANKIAKLKTQYRQKTLT